MPDSPVRPVNSPRQILTASLMGTAIEFFDFYIYATAAVLVFPALFFPSSDPATGALASMATFAIAFLAASGRLGAVRSLRRSRGSQDHAGGRAPHDGAVHGRHRAGAHLRLDRHRGANPARALPIGQGLGLGGEWGGAILLATENAPPGRRAWYGMFPQLGAPIGFFCSGGIFLVISRLLTDEQFFAWGWRIPFLSSAVLVVVGLYVRLTLTETPAFQKVLAHHERVKVPMFTVFTSHKRALILGTVIATSVFVDFYLTTVFMLSWGTTALGYTREHFLFIQLFGVVFFALGVPWSARLAEGGRRAMLLWVNAGMAAYAVAMPWLFAAGTPGVVAGMAIGFLFVGLSYGPIGTVLAELFPAAVRYTGSSLTYNLAGILGASVAPYAAQMLAREYGLPAVATYLAAFAMFSFCGLLLTGETKDAEV